MKKLLIDKPLSIRVLLVPLLAGSLFMAGCSSDDDDNTADADNSGVTDTGGSDINSGDDTNSDAGDSDASDADTDSTETDSTDTTTDINAILTTVASDFSSSAIEIYDAASRTEGLTGLNPGVSDTIVRAFEDKYYVIRRFMSDSVSAHSASDPSTVIFETSTNDGTDTASSNPHDLVFVDSQKGYLLRYGSPNVWIVNPSATSASEFKIGEIDLSAYDADGVPEATRAVIVGDRMFVFMQRLELFAPTLPGVVAVIDTTTDTEIDTGSDGDLNGFEIPAFNPNDVSLDTSTDSIFVAAVGDFGAFDGSRPPALTGGIVSVDTENFTATQLIDDTEETGRITAVEVIDANTAYMITETAFLSSTLVKFDPNTGTIESTGVAGFADVDLRDIAKGPEGNLWVAVGNTTSPQVVVVNPADDSVIGPEINTTLIPTGITFAE